MEKKAFRCLHTSDHTPGSTRDVVVGEMNIWISPTVKFQVFNSIGSLSQMLRWLGGLGVVNGYQYQPTAQRGGRADRNNLRTTSFITSVV